ncbi:MAG TPA: ACT domain-containing protein [Mucilaginibacter sp.]|nr:ACT domain-containing protein [Mucilaginibacter sp.]
MAAETNLDTLLKTMKPQLNPGDFVFCTIKDPALIDSREAVMIFKEEEGFTLIINREIADRLKLSYSYIASWITLTVHSSLGAVGLTAAFSKALTGQGISCNVVAGYYHDHLFIDKQDADTAMDVLNGLSK